MKFAPAKEHGAVTIELGPNESQLPGAAPSPVFRLKKIMVPIDFSNCSRKALAYAIPLAKQFQAEIILLSVTERFPPLAEAPPFDSNLVQEEANARTKTELRKLQRELPDEVHAHVAIGIGHPHSQIVAKAKALHVDLIVISTHGRTGLRHVFMGSTAERVVRYAPCPVLVVREKEHDFLGAEAEPDAITI